MLEVVTLLIINMCNNNKGFKKLYLQITWNKGMDRYA